MNSILVAGTRIVILALISYSIAIITEQRKQLVTRTVLIFITLGIILDIVATLFMILGSSNTPFTLHGIIGYSSLAAMLTDAGLLWRHKIKFDSSTKVPRSLHLYSRFAYIWWVLAFITGALLVFLK
jgi:hypothetical protein